MIKTESTWRREIKEQTPQLTLLYCGRTVRRSRRCYIKISQYPQDIPVSKSLFKNITGLAIYILIKKKPLRRCFPVNIAKYLRLPILRSICERLLFDCFNGSLLHGPKGSSSKLYDSDRFQVLSLRSSFFCF